jgi:uncharacterized membrane protein
MSNETNQAPATSGIDGKTIAIISYFSVVGWIIAYVLYTSNKSQMAIYHLRQSLALMLCGIACYILFFITIFFLFFLKFVFILLGIGLFVLWLIALISAINGEQKPVPVLGKIAQDIFAGIK